MIAKWLEDLAADFWEQAGGACAFPVDLEHAIHCTKFAAVFHIPNLRPACVNEWLAWRRFPVAIDTRDRRLNGCLVAHDGRGLIFVETHLSADEQRVIIAHELGHFLAEYERPRARARRRIGAGIIAVFDARQAATPGECLEATLAGVPLGAHVHYMERLEGGDSSEPTNQVEQTANDLALELVAPWRQVLAAAGRQASTEKWTTLLHEMFGVPASWGASYAERLRRHVRASRSFTESLGM